MVYLGAFLIFIVLQYDLAIFGRKVSRQPSKTLVLAVFVVFCFVALCGK